MKNILVSLVMCLQFGLVLAQDNKMTIVAVGEAELEKDTISFVKPSLEKLNNKEKQQINEFYEIMKSDFSFYKHLFDMSSKEYSKISEVSKSVRFVFSSEIDVIENKVWLSYKLFDKSKKENLIGDRKIVWFNNIRSFAHTISNDLYKAITGKESIFLSKIVFTSDRTSVGRKMRKEVYVMDFDGARKRRLTYDNSIVISPAVSPDGNKIVYTLVDDIVKRLSDGSKNKIKNLNLYSLDLKTKQKRILSSQDGINSGAVFNKSGDSIYLTLSLNKNADIYKMNLSTKKLSRVTTHFSEDVDPHINSNETLMTFLSGRPGKAMIYTLDPSGKEKSVKRISYVGEFNAAPRFNPDGSEIVFSSWVDNRFDIYRIGSDGNNLSRLTKNFGSNEEPWFSPDGEFIVFSSQRVLSRSKADQDLYIMNRDGEVIRKITENYGKIYTPRWSK
jgi:TolB protein